MHNIKNSDLYKKKIMEVIVKIQTILFLKYDIMHF